ncbi:hypothetical protein HK096_010263, partial [Nowakowskiella sp. JEL0078]
MHPFYQYADMLQLLVYFCTVLLDAMDGILNYKVSFVSIYYSGIKRMQINLQLDEAIAEHVLDLYIRQQGVFGYYEFSQFSFDGTTKKAILAIARE